MVRNTRAVWTAVLFIELFALPAIDWRAPPRPPDEVRGTVPALLQQAPDIVCLLADAMRRQVNSPVVSCPPKEAA